MNLNHMFEVRYQGEVMERFDQYLHALAWTQHLYDIFTAEKVREFEIHKVEVFDVEVDA